MRKLIGVGVLLAWFNSPASADDLSAMQQRLNELQTQVQSLQAQLKALEQKSRTPAREASASGDGSAKFLLSGEGAVAYFDTPGEGAFPHNEFRVDEARLFLDARLLDDAFLYAELNLYQREDPNTDVNVGELYVDLENVSALWSESYPLTLRAGRFNIPFGEEYLSRDAINNPLISHSLEDLWGVDEGVELFGESGRFDYVVAVQNGGYHKLDDGDPDKALVGRVGWRPVKQARVSVSAMRTGDLDVQKDECGELWFGNLFLAPLGAPETTTEFHYELAELDARWSWKGGHVAGAWGTIQYDDDDTAADRSTDAVYWHVEGVQDLASKLYAGLRLSVLSSSDGFPALGQGRYEPAVADMLVDDVWRLSLGLGWRWSKDLVLKTEYSFERGDRTDGRDVEDQDQFATQIAFGF